MVEIKKELDDDIVVIGLENKDFYVEVTNFGCTLLKAVVKDKEGNPCDCVLGFPEVSDYQKRDGTYLGALVGRVCNRIEKGTFTLNGKTYNVPKPAIVPRQTGAITEFLRNSSRLLTFERCTSITGMRIAAIASRIA